jgi:hypothetical protein
MSRKGWINAGKPGPEHDCRHSLFTPDRGDHCRFGIDLETFRKAGQQLPCGNWMTTTHQGGGTRACARRGELTRAEGIVVNNAAAMPYGEHQSPAWPAVPAARVSDPKAARRREICSGVRFGEDHTCRYPACAGEQDYCDQWDSAAMRRICVVTTGAAKP